MKRMAALLLTLTLLAVGGSVLVGFTVNRQRDRVTVEEKTVYGDPAAARGLCIHSKVRAGEYLFWDTSFRVGEDVSTSFHFDGAGQNVVGGFGGEDFMLSSDLQTHGGMYGSPMLESTTGIERVYWELAQQMEVGEEETLNVDLRTYFDVYPLSMEIHLPGTLFFGGESRDISCDAAAVSAHFREFFAIPITDPLPAKIQVERVSENSYNGSLQHSEEFYDPAAVSTHTDSRCFFAIKNHTPAGNPVDMSRVPGGYGIYSFSYKRVTNWDGHSGGFTIPAGYITGVDAPSLRMVFPLEETTEVLALQADGYRNELQMVTREPDGTYFIVIDMGTMTVQQKIPLFEEGAVQIFSQGNTWAVACGDWLTALDCSETDSYVRLFTVQMPESMYSEILWEEEDMYFPASESSWRDIHLMYHNGRLAFLTKSRLTGNDGYFLAVIDREGVQYGGNLQNSLLSSPYRQGSLWCQIYETELTWE